MPRLLRRLDGRRMLGDVQAVQATDRWNSFDRFHETTHTLVGRYEGDAPGLPCVSSSLAYAPTEIHSSVTGNGTCLHFHSGPAIW